MRVERRSVLSRADLVRLRLAGVTLDAGIAASLGYARRGPEIKAEPEVEMISLPALLSPNHDSNTESLLPGRQGRKDPVFWTIRDDGAVSETSAMRSGSIDSIEQFVVVREREPDALPKFQPLVKSVDVRVRLEGFFGGRRLSRRLDVQAAVRQLAQARPVVDWPRRWRDGVSGEIVLLIDGHERLRPLVRDYMLVAAEARDLWGYDLVRRVLLPGGTEGSWRPMGGDSIESIERLPPGSRVVLLSDVNLPDPGIEQFMSARRLRARLVAQGHAVHSWSMISSTPDTKVVEWLVSALSRRHFSAPEHLRALRCALDAAGFVTTVADELAAWNHADRDDDVVWHWAPRLEARRQRIDRYSVLPEAVQNAFEPVLLKFRAAAHDDVACLEGMLGHHAGIEAKPCPHWLDASIDARDNDDGIAEHWWRFVLPIFAVTAPYFSSDPEFQAAYKTAQQVAYRHGQAQPAGHRLMPDIASSVELSLVQVRSELHLVRECGQRPALHRSTGPWLDRDSGLAFAEGCLESAERIRRIRLPTRMLELWPVKPPVWATEIWRDRGGLFARHASGMIFEYRSDASTSHHEAWTLIDGKLGWISNAGTDRHGLWAAFSIKNVEHRLRWIPPGNFLMGSPETESERFDNEIQHRVTLTEGYWLAEAACPQGLWEAVTRESRSRFKGAERPVEQVSWEAIQGFCAQLNEQIPELNARLPTEAEWEYAARAGTEAAFWWGNKLSVDRANYDGSSPYADGESGEFREETVDVRSYEANPWGLYQVHGNVWEWCSDWYRSYEESDTIDPRGPKTGECRVFRGGSWFVGGGWLRTACRNYGPPGLGYGFIGFRLAAGQETGAERG